jgi:DNA-binding transcriptional MerR regulator
MAIYQIKDLEKLTGIKAHTIRVWEQRFGLVVPSRTRTNIRYYNDENLRDLFNISLLNRKGIKISKIAEMSKDEINFHVLQHSEATIAQPAQIDSLTLAMLEMNEVSTDNIFNSYIVEKGFEATMTELVYPFLDKLNVLWLTGSIHPAHEKFISNLIKRKLMVAIDQVKVEVAPNVPSFMLFLREGESQELTLLYMQYFLRLRGLKVIYLGTNVPLSDLQQACQALHPQYLFTIINEPLHRQSLQSYIDTLSQIAGNGKLLLSGQQIYTQPTQPSHNTHILDGLDATLHFLERIKHSSIVDLILH